MMAPLLGKLYLAAPEIVNEITPSSELYNSVLNDSLPGKVSKIVIVFLESYISLIYRNYFIYSLI